MAKKNQDNDISDLKSDLANKLATELKYRQQILDTVKDQKVHASKMYDWEKKILTVTEQALENGNEVAKINELAEEHYKTIVEIQEKINNLSESEKLEKEALLKVELDVANAQWDRLLIQKQKLAALEQEKNLAEEVTQKYDKQLDKIKEQVEKVPLIGGFLGKQTDKLKEQAASVGKNYAQAFSQAKAGGKSAFGAMRAGIGAATKGMMGLVAAAGPLLAIALAVAAISYAWKRMFALDSATTEFARNMGTSKEAAAEMENHFLDITTYSNDASLSMKGMVQAQQELATAFSGTAMYSDQMLKDQVKITKFMGLSSEEAANFQKISMLSGKTARQMQGDIAASVKSFNDATGASLPLKDVMKDIQGISTSVRMRFKDNVEELVKATAQAKLLGTTVDEIAQATDAMLNIEQSLSAELEASLMLGRDINLDTARQLALKGDVLGAGEAMLDQMGSLAEFQEMMPLQQKALADAMGMSVDKVGEMLESAEMQKKLGVDIKDATLDQIKNNAQLTEQEKEKLIKEKEALSMEERKAAMQEKLAQMGDKIIKAIMPLVDTIMEMLDFIMPILGWMIDVWAVGFKRQIDGIIDNVKIVLGYFEGWWKILKGIFTLDFSLLKEGFIMVGQSIIDFLLWPLKQVLRLVDGIAGFFGFDTGLASGLEELTDIGGRTESVGDAVISPDGDVISTSPEDYLIATKNPEALAGTVSGGGGGTDNSAVIAKLEELKNAILNMQPVVKLGDKFVSELTNLQSVNKGSTQSSIIR